LSKFSGAYQTIASYAKNLTQLVEAMECVIDKGTTGNDFYLYHKENKHAIVLLMTEASDVIPEIYESIFLSKKYFAFVSVSNDRMARL
jgi:hypothetical protein